MFVCSNWKKSYIYFSKKLFNFQLKPLLLLPIARITLSINLDRMHFKIGKHHVNQCNVIIVNAFTDKKKIRHIRFIWRQNTEIGFFIDMLYSPEWCNAFKINWITSFDGLNLKLNKRKINYYITTHLLL
jgi:hypothetical protein